MKIKILNDANLFVLGTSITKADVELLKKSNPDALKIKDEEGDEIFAINHLAGTNSLAPFGITFGGVNDADELSVTCILPDAESLLDDVVDLITPIAKYLEQLEASIPEEANKVREAREKLIEKVISI